MISSELSLLILQQMKAIRGIHSGLASVDLFSAQQFLRYKGDADYKTATGGFCSLLVIIIFIILFINSGLNVINKTNVIVSSDIQHQIDPSLTTVTVGPAGRFMFALTIAETGISDANYTYFSFTLEQSQDSELGAVSKKTNIPLESCTLGHFNFNSDIASQYTKNGVGSWLCPPLGYDFSVGGSLLSDVYQYLSIMIKKCDSKVYSNCVPDSIFQQKMNLTGQFSAVMAIVTTQINPSNTDGYLGYYVEARNVFPFTTSIGVKATAQIQDYQIGTDVSLLPIEKKLVQTGAYVPELLEHHTIPVVNSNFVYIKFDKSTSAITYNRSFQKIDDFLSYVGGLVGLVLSLIFIIAKYSELSFEISLGSRLFRLNPDTAIDSGSFNFLTYLCFLAFKLGRWLGCCRRFQMMQAYLRCHQEVEKQIDIQELLQRIATLERGLHSLIGPADFQLLYFAEKPTLEEAKVRRERSHLYTKYRRKETKDQKGDEGSDKPPLPDEKALFSQQSSYSSMRSQKYRSLKRQFQQLANGEANNKFLNQEFLKALKEEAGKQCVREQEKGSEDTKNLIGDGYFKQIENNRIKAAHNAGWSHLKRRQNDQL